MAQNELERQKQLVEYEVEALLITLNQHFREIRLFQKYRLPEAQQAKNNAQHRITSYNVCYTKLLRNVLAICKDDEGYMWFGTYA